VIQYPVPLVTATTTKATALQTFRRNGPGRSCWLAGPYTFFYRRACSGHGRHGLGRLVYHVSTAHAWRLRTKQCVNDPQSHDDDKNGRQVARHGETATTEMTRAHFRRTILDE
jgi:hypothetical protein